MSKPIIWGGGGGGTCMAQLEKSVDKYHNVYEQKTERMDLDYKMHVTGKRNRNRNTSANNPDRLAVPSSRNIIDGSEMDDMIARTVLECVWLDKVKKKMTSAWNRTIFLYKLLINHHFGEIAICMSLHMSHKNVQIGAPIAQTAAL
ncbi:hypothetical protein ACJX0J_015225, partial [Zea mays]